MQANIQKNHELIIFFSCDYSKSFFSNIEFMNIIPVNLKSALFVFLLIRADVLNNLLFSLSKSEQIYDLCNGKQRTSNMGGLIECLQTNEGLYNSSASLVLVQSRSISSNKYTFLSIEKTISAKIVLKHMNENKHKCS